MTDAQALALQLVADLHLRHGRSDRAAALLAAVDLLRPGRPDVLRALAWSQLRCGHVDDALHTLDRLAMAGERHAGWHLLLARALTAGSRRVEAAVAMSACLALRQAQPAAEVSA